MEKKIEEKLIQELEEEKNGKEEKDTNKNELTGEDIKESYSLNTINKSKNIQYQMKLLERLKKQRNQ